mgnify:CR=1 FL=1|tara:strand:+ start:3387 stop:4952 length:1566 start_codon:yes stop_codon:yes gene_type:complete
MKIIFIIILTFTLKPYFSYAEKTSNYFNKALNFYKSGDYDKSTFFIKKNISKKKSHFPSLKLLSKIYTKKEKYSKALKIYLSILRALHYPINLNLNSKKTLEGDLNNIPVPKIKAREVYYLIAKTYWLSSKSNIYSKKVKRLNLIRSLRYFQICNFYKIKPKSTALHLAIIRKKLGDSDLAEINLSQFSRLIKNDKKIKSMPQKAKVLLGNVYLDSGQYRKGLLISNSVRKESSSNSKSLQKKIQEESSNFNLLIGRSFDSNLTKTENSKKIQDSVYSETKIDYNFRTTMKNDTSYLFGLSFNQDVMEKNQLSHLDSKSLELKVGFLRNNFSSFLLSSTYSFKNISSKLANSLTFQNNLNLHSIETSLHSASTKGLHSWKLSLTAFDYLNQGDNVDLGLKWFYEPFSKTVLFSPTYGLSLLIFKNKYSSSMTTETKTSITNRSIISYLKLKLSTHLNYSYQYNKNSSYNLHQVEFINMLNIPIGWLENLYFFPSIKYSFIKKKNTDLFTKWRGSANLSLTF